jgi:hypothetical protein
MSETSESVDQVAIQIEALRNDLKTIIDGVLSRDHAARARYIARVQAGCKLIRETVSDLEIPF